MATADKKATAKASVKAAKNAKRPSKAKKPSAPKKEKGTPKNLMTFYVSAKGTVISGHVTSKNKANPYFEFSIDGNQLQLRWAPKGTTAASLRILKASLVKNTAQDFCEHVREKVGHGICKTLLPIFAWLIERVKNDTLDQPKIGRCWRTPFQKKPEAGTPQEPVKAPKKVAFKVGSDRIVRTKIRAPHLLVELTGSDVEMWHVWGSNPKEETALVFGGSLKSNKPARYRVKKSVTVPESQRILAIAVLDWLMDHNDNNNGVGIPQKGFRFSLEKPDSSIPLFGAANSGTTSPAANSTTESVFTRPEFLQRTRAWQLSQVTGYDMLVCDKMLQTVGYDLDAAYAAFLDIASRTASNMLSELRGE